MAQCRVEKGESEYAARLLEEAVTTSEGKDPAALFNMGVLLLNPNTSLYKPAKAATYLYQFLLLHRKNPEFRDETARAAQTMARLSRSIPQELQNRIIDGLDAAMRERSPNDRLRVANMTLRIHCASIPALQFYAKYLRETGNRAQAADTEEILALIRK
jgi:hypothetical protein